MDCNSVVMDTFPISSSVCIFCLQNDPRERNMEKEAEVRFFRLVQRHLEEDGKGSGKHCRPEGSGNIFSLLSSAVDMTKVGSCEECFGIIHSYCDVFHKMKCLELELDWKLERLRSVMKRADEDAGRIGSFRDFCLLERWNMEKSMEFRRKFQKQCKLTCGRKFPKVRLRHTKASSRTEGNCEPDQNTDFVPIPQSELTIVSTTSIQQPHAAAPNNDAEHNINVTSCPASPDVPASPIEPLSDNEPDIFLPPPITSTTDEPPTKKLKLSSSKTTEQIEVDISKVKESPSKQFQQASITIDATTIKQEVLACCTTTVSTSENLDDHLADSHPIDTIVACDDENCNDDINDEAETGADPDWIAEENPNNGHDEERHRDIKKITRSKQHKKPEESGVNNPEESVSKRARSSLPVSGNSFQCQACPAPRPTFASFDRQKIHQNYLHSNGYISLTVTENHKVLRLKEKDLKLVGIRTKIKHCSKFFPECRKKFMRKAELTAHKKYHGDVKCSKCDVVMNNAVDMVHHEMDHFKNEDEQDTEKAIMAICGRCPYSTLLEGDLINHYLEVHMQKPPLQATCPICQQQFPYVDKVPVIHYLNYHDLTRLEDPSSNGIRCMEVDCSAYFLTEDQLQQHWTSVHMDKSGTSIVTPVKRTIKSESLVIRNRSKGFNEKCKYCPKKFRIEAQLKEHVWAHHADIEKGEPCGKIKLTEKGLTIDEFITEKKSVCKICKKIFGSREQLGRHKPHHGEFKCNFCHVVKTMAPELAVHEIVHKNKNEKAGEPGKLNCPRCTFTTTKRPDYIDHHLETHLGLSSDRKRCPICTKPVSMSSIAKPGGLKIWIISHYMENHDKTGLDPESIPKCALCPAYFRTAVKLHNHSREIHGQSNFECSDCGKVFKKKDKLHRHRRSVHKVDESTFLFVCSFPDCGHRFERQKELDYHEGRSHNEKDVGILLCTHCGKKCLGRGQLHAHLKTHEKKDPIPKKSYMCEQCGKSFKDNSALQTHYLWHKGPESWEFLCSICSKKFMNKAKLNSHMISHSTEKQFTCKLCDAAYAHHHNLRLHMKKKHENEDAESTKD